jgi:hypothetical protein
MNSRVPGISVISSTEFRSVLIQYEQTKGSTAVEIWKIISDRAVPSECKVKLLLAPYVNVITFTKILARRIGVAEETFLSKELNGFRNDCREGLPVEVIEKITI